MLAKRATNRLAHHLGVLAPTTTPSLRPSASDSRNTVVTRSSTMATQAQGTPAGAGAPPPEITSEPLLLSSWSCPYVQRVTLALAHKKAKIRVLPINLADKPSWLTTYSPLGKVPAVTYLEGGKQQVLYESLALLPWVDEYYEGPSLLPGTPAERTHARIVIARADSGVSGGFGAAVRASTKEDFKAQWDKLQAELTWLEHNIHPTGPFLTGDGSKPGLVDAAIAPFLLRHEILRHWRNVEPLGNHPRLLKFLEAYIALPELADTWKHPEGVGYKEWSKAVVLSYVKFAKEQRDYSDVVRA